MSRRFTNTRRAGLRPLGTSDQRIYETIASEAERALGPAHAAIFAEPEYLRRTASSDWYSSVEGVITSLADMSEADAARTKRRLLQLLGDISRHASELKQQGADADRRLGAALEQAVLYPSDSSIFGAIQADGSIQPILVDWAYERDVVRRADSTLGATVSAVPSYQGARTQMDSAQDTEQSTIARKARPPWWWVVLPPMWMFAAGLAVVLIWLLIEPCGIALGPWANACPREAVAQANQPMRYRAVLEQQEADLRRRIAEAERACLPSEDEADRETDRRLKEAEATTGDLEMTLTWENKSDLDIAVECPTGDKINHRDMIVAACRGALDVDRNNNTSKATSSPVEHVVFTDPLPGTYTITVTLYNNHHPPPETNAFLLRIKSAAGSQTLSGSVSPGRKTWTSSITFP